jgi:hypothetical protein
MLLVTTHGIITSATPGEWVAHHSHHRVEVTAVNSLATSICTEPPTSNLNEMSFIFQIVIHDYKPGGRVIYFGGRIWFHKCRDWCWRCIEDERHCNIKNVFYKLISLSLDLRTTLSALREC